jgi:transcriptional regulator with XRE-family HTH domain
MTIKKQRGRKRKGYVYTGDDLFLEKQVEKSILLKEEKEAFLDSFKFIIGRYLYRARNGVGMTGEELGLKIGVNASQLQKYETAETSISTSRFFLAILYLFNNRDPQLMSFFLSLTKDIQKSFNEKNIDFKKDIKVKESNHKINKIKTNIQEEMLKMEEQELKNILQFLKLINKNKKNILSTLSIEEI